jgi:hypothetical protein
MSPDKRGDCLKIGTGAAEARNSAAMTEAEGLDSGDVWVIQGCQRPGFPFEASHALRVLRDRVRQHLYCDLPAQGRVGGAVHFPHAARAIWAPIS